MRHGSDVAREKFESLDEAIAEARRRIDQVRGEGGLSTASGFRDYAPGQQVHARVELTGPGVLRGREGGIDVMGDGSLVPYKGTIRKRPLGGDGVDESIERLREALG